MAFNLTEFIQSVRCCITNAAWNISHNDLLGITCNSEEALLMNAKYQIIKDFIPVGSVITPSTITDATFDLNDITDFPDPLYFGDFTVDNTIIANINDFFADLDELLDALVAAIIAYGNGYSAVNNGDGTITITFPPNTISATATVSITFYSTLKVFGTTFLGSSPNNGVTLLAVSPNDGVCLTGLRDGEIFGYQDEQVTGELWGGSADFAAGFAGDAVYTPITDSFYVLDQSANKVYPIDTAGTLGAALLTAAGAIINSPTCVIYNSYSADQNVYFTTSAGIGSTIPAYPNTGNQYPRRVLGKINGAGQIKPVDFYSNNSYDCFSMIASSWDGSIWMMPNTANNVNNPLSSNFGNPSIKVVQGIWNATETGVINMASSPGVTEVVIPIPEVTAQHIQTIAFYTGTSQATSRMFAMQMKSVIIINPVDFSKVTIYFDNTLGGLNLLDVSEDINAIYYSELYSLFLVGTNEGNIFSLRYVADNFVWTQTIDSGRANVGALRKFADNEFSSSISYIGEASPASISFEDQYGTLTQSSGGFLFDDPTENVTAEVLQTADDNCQTEQMIEDAAEQITLYCGGCVSCNGDIQDINSGGGTGQLQGTVYFGRSASTSLDEAGILALTARTQPNFAGAYAFAALINTYTYIAYPTAWGSPSSVIDTNTLFPIALLTPYTTVTVLGQSYTVLRSFYQLGGAISETLNQ